MGFSAATISYIEIASAVAAAAGTAVSVYASVEAGEQAKKAADFNARVSENDAAYAESEAMQRADKIRKIGRAQQAEANSALAGSGVKLSEGSAVDITRTVEQQTELDAFNTILQGRRASTSSLDQAGLQRAQGTNAQASGYIGAGATILGSAGKVASGWRTTATKPNSGYADFIKGYTPENYG